MRQPGGGRLSSVTTYEPPSQEEPRSIESWLAEGIEAGWCTKWYCEHHEAIAQEDHEAWEELYDLTGGDTDAFCWPIVRLKVAVSDRLRG